MKSVDVKEKASEREARVLSQWKEEDTFQKSVTNRAEKPSYVLFEGPPTANGLPHIGHVLGRVIKDFVGRYRTMTGYRVVRKAGWDTHGLPVELGVEKELGISGKQEIEEYGVQKFVEKCRDSVFAYEKEWRRLTEAIGYWTDMDDPYVTLNNEYIESVWHILSTIHRKGLLYKGHRVSPYCPCCQTSLSSHEVAQGYEQVKDLSVIAKFPAKEADFSFLAWTTTPWTLPANTALAIHPDLSYSKVRLNGEQYLMASNLVESVMKEGYELISTHTGDEFVGMAYEAPYFTVQPEHGHVVIKADFVSDASGTGIVHMAPAHGEDDYRAAQQHGISMIQVVDRSGKYTEAVGDLAGKFVKDCDVDIIRNLADRGLLFHKERFEHSYPFCWRCKSPLLYYAMESWFIKTTAVKEQLIENNRSIQWYPEHIREGRFGKFLEDLVDWNISRNRYWGTPLNVWECKQCGAEYAPESREDLRNRAVSNLPEEPELHKPYVDEIRLHCPQCEGQMERTPEVIDVWFDSGSMPFAQYHYPFNNEAKFADQFPADMICEGVDQTRGWFFSLLAVSTLYTGKAPYRAVISTGLVLDEQGQKMSKSKGNVVDPWEILNDMGADAFRWALLSDSAPWNSKRFSKSIVAEAKSKVIDTLNNAHAFLTLYAQIDGFSPAQHPKPTQWDHELDRWILSRLNSVIRTVRAELDQNQFLNPARQIEKLIDDISNWYIRRSRDRFWGSEMTTDKISAYYTLTEVLTKVSQLIAPFAPFLSEEIYRNLVGGESVHLSDFPTVDESMIDSELERNMQMARHMVELGRNVRNVIGIKTRQPLSELIVSLDQPFPLTQYQSLIQEELNVKKVRIQADDHDFVDYTVKLNLKVAGPKYGKQVGAMRKAVEQLSPAEARQVVEQGQFLFSTESEETITLTKEELLIEKQAKPGFASTSSSQMTVALHTEITPQLMREGWIRELVRGVQDLRKQQNLAVEQRVDLVLEVNAEMKQAIQEFEGILRENVLVKEIRFGQEEAMERLTIADHSVGVTIQA